MGEANENVVKINHNEREHEVKFLAKLKTQIHVLCDLMNECERREYGEPGFNIARDQAGAFVVQGIRVLKKL